MCLIPQFAAGRRETRLRCVSLLTLLLATTGCYGAPPATPPQRVLYVFTQPSCGPCRRFKADLHAGRLPGITRRFAVRVVEFDPEVAWQRRYAIHSLPTFVTADGRLRVEGYAGPTEFWHQINQE